MSSRIALFVVSISFTLNTPLLSLTDQCRDERMRSLWKPCASARAASMMMFELTCAARRSSVLRKLLRSRSNSAGLSVSLHAFSNLALKPSSTHAASATTSPDKLARSRNPLMTSVCVFGTILARCCAYTIFRNVSRHYFQNVVYWPVATKITIYKECSVDRQEQITLWTLLHGAKEALLMLGRE
jgi:hypothetical protein